MLQEINITTNPTRTEMIQIQKVVLYYVQEVKTTLLVPIGSITPEQSKGKS